MGHISLTISFNARDFESRLTNHNQLGLPPFDPLHSTQGDSQDQPPMVKGLTERTYTS